MEIPASWRAGFTLVELIVVIGIIGVLGTIGIGSFLEYSHSQTVNIAANQVIDTLNLARSNALSQLKPSVCGATSLDGYKMIISNNKTYRLYARCGNTDRSVATAKSLPDNVIFASTTPSTFFFTVLTGKVVITGSLNITISGLGKIRNITVSSTGVIQ